MLKYVCIILAGLFVCMNSFAQGDFILTKEGKKILNRREVIGNCLRSMKKNREDATALSICECQVNLVDKRFTYKQYKRYTRGGLIDMESLLKEDETVDRQMQDCLNGSGYTQLLQAESFEDESMRSCVDALLKNSEKKADTSKLMSFCQCQVDMIKQKKLSDKQMEALSNPNSLLYYETLYKCGDPFELTSETERNWTKDAAQSIEGPASDTIKVLHLNGLTYLQIKTGSMVQFWLFDTGASDMLVNAEMETQLKNEGWMNEADTLGSREYEMANGTVETCRRYKVNALKIGSYTVNNVTLAVTEKGKRIIAGKSLFNKFSNWVLDNKNNVLVLHK